jgi:hypothetical protein
MERSPDLMTPLGIPRSTLDARIKQLHIKKHNVRITFTLPKFGQLSESSSLRSNGKVFFDRTNALGEDALTA